ncbi:MAG: DUF1636 domain-containing protein [Marinovum sp.]|nr:DUF1636 domain-containing protein [Marinovum sp.]
MMDGLAPAELLICVKCRRGTEVAEGGDRPGAVLFQAIAERELDPGITVSAVECLQNCSQGCSVVMRGGDARWTYVYGNLHEASDIDTLVDGVGLYHDTKDGVIPWRQRPDHFKRNCIARVPPVAPAVPKLT